FLAVAFLIPLGSVIYLSFTDPTPSLGNYWHLVQTPLYIQILANTFKTAVIVTISCLLLGYPLAYVMVQARGWFAWILLAIVTVNFWLGFVVRTYAWLVIF